MDLASKFRKNLLPSKAKPQGVPLENATETITGPSRLPLATGSHNLVTDFVFKPFSVSQALSALKGLGVEGSGAKR